MSRRNNAVGPLPCEGEGWGGVLKQNQKVEVCFGSLKSEWVKERCYADAESAKQDISKYVIEYYNMWRPHTHLGGLSPNEYEVAA